MLQDSSGALERSASFEKFKDKRTNQDQLVWVKKQVQCAKKLSDITDLISFLNSHQAYEMVHLGICSLDGIRIVDTIHSCPIPGTGLSVSDFPDELKWPISQEGEHLLRPFNLLTHEFETADSNIFADVRNLALMSGVKQLMIIPMRVKNTITSLVINFPQGDFEEHAGEVLPRAYQFIVAVFERFPKLLLWPTPGKLTPREAEILTLSANGLTEAAIAEKCGISINTVRNHVENSKAKLNARNKLHAVMIAAETHEIDSILEG